MKYTAQAESKNIPSARPAEDNRIASANAFCMDRGLSGPYSPFDSRTVSLTSSSSPTTVDESKLLSGGSSRGLGGLGVASLDCMLHVVFSLSPECLKAQSWDFLRSREGWDFLLD